MKVIEIFFSPTGGTKKVVDIVAEALSETVVKADITVSDKACSVEIGREDLCVVGVPSFGGRVPAVAAERLSKVKANGAKAVLVCVYGNRAYEDTLVELEDLAKLQGFDIGGAIAAVAEHSIARTYAAGRPDSEDRKMLQDFAQKIKEKLQKGDVSVPNIPGNRPYKKSSGGGIVPKPNKNCTQCGICAVNCPTGAIDKKDPAEVDKTKCISCMRCVSVCPNQARKVNKVMLVAVNAMLKKACSERKNCELFL